VGDAREPFTRFQVEFSGSHLADQGGGEWTEPGVVHPERSLPGLCTDPVRAGVIEVLDDHPLIRVARLAYSTAMPGLRCSVSRSTPRVDLAFAAVQGPEIGSRRDTCGVCRQPVDRHWRQWMSGEVWHH
jgi:hypothetical protein